MVTCRYRKSENETKCKVTNTHHYLICEHMCLSQVRSISIINASSDLRLLSCPLAPNGQIALLCISRKLAGSVTHQGFLFRSTPHQTQHSVSLSCLPPIASLTLFV